VDWTQIVVTAVPWGGVIALVLLVRKPVRNLIQAANELEVTRDGLKIRAERQVKELSREAAAAFPEGAVRMEAGEARVVSLASRDQRDRFSILEFREYLEHVAALDPRTAVLEAFERVQAGLASRFGKHTFPPPGDAEAAELVRRVLDAQQYRVYELMYPVYVTARRNEGFSLSHETATQYCDSAVALVWLIERNPAIQELDIKAAPHEHLGLFEESDIGEGERHVLDHQVVDVVLQLFFEEEEPSVTDDELALFIWGMAVGLEPESDDRSKEEWLEVARRVRAMLTDESDHD
jgi:hypothetical protein